MKPTIMHPYLPFALAGFSVFPTTPLLPQTPQTFDRQHHSHPSAIAPVPDQVAQVPYVPTASTVVVEMLRLAGVGKDDVVYDLGSGDGRIVITAAQQFGARGVGIEINPSLVEKSRENARLAGLSDRVQFIRQDLFKAKLSDATVVTLYLLPGINKLLQPKLRRELKPGTRIVSHDYDLGDGWKPDRVIQLNGPMRNHTLYLWIVPATTQL